MSAWCEYLVDQSRAEEARQGLPGSGNLWLTGLLGNMRRGVTPEAQRELERVRLMEEAQTTFATLARAREQRLAPPGADQATRPTLH